MNNNKILKEIVKTRAVLKEKLKNIKLNDVEEASLLEDTFQPITTPLKNIIEKLDDNNNKHLHSPLQSKLKDEEEDDDVTDTKQSILSKTTDDNEKEIKDDKTKHIFHKKRQNESQLNIDKKRVKFDDNLKNSSLFNNIKQLMKNGMLDKVYRFNIDSNGNWRYGTNKLKFSRDNSLQIGEMNIKITPGLFELLFHSKPLHYTKMDLKNYKGILTNTNVYKRNYQSNKQVKATKGYKY